MAKDFLPQIGERRRRAASGVAFVLTGVTLVGLLMLGGLVGLRWVPGLRGRVSALEAALDQERAAREAAEARLAEAERQLAGMSAASGVTILYGGDGESLPKEEVQLPFTRQGPVIVHNNTGKSIYYFTASGETLGSVAAQPNTLGSWYLWPVLREENQLEAKGDSKLGDGTLLKIPKRVGDWRIRSATTAAGAPDAVRNEIFAQAGIE